MMQIHWLALAWTPARPPRHLQRVTAWHQLLAAPMPWGGCLDVSGRQYHTVAMRTINRRGREAVAMRPTNHRGRHAVAMRPTNHRGRHAVAIRPIEDARVRPEHSPHERLQSEPMRAHERLHPEPLWAPLLDDAISERTCTTCVHERSHFCRARTVTTLCADPFCSVDSTKNCYASHGAPAA